MITRKATSKAKGKVSKVLPRESIESTFEGREVDDGGGTNALSEGNAFRKEANSTLENMRVSESNTVVVNTSGRRESLPIPS